MKKVRRRKMFVALGVVLVLVGMVIIWFNIGYSPVKKQFKSDITTLLTENQLTFNGEIFTADDFADLPSPVQKYIENCGYENNC